MVREAAELQEVLYPLGALEEHAGQFYLVVPVPQFLLVLLGVQVLTVLRLETPVPAAAVAALARLLRGPGVMAAFPQVPLAAEALRSILGQLGLVALEVPVS